MATAAALDEASNVECTVCHEHFTLPKLLPCGHLLCRHCLVSWLKSQPEASCPLCRCAIVDPKDRKGRSLEDIADGFPTDLAMAALVEADRLLSKQRVCCVCVNVAAVSLCLTCGDMFCQSCSTVHKKQSLSKHHKVENLTSLTVEKLAANRPATCAVHDDEVSKLFCPTHGVSICLFCATADHRQCPDVTKLEKRMEQARAELAKLVAMLSAGETELDTAISQLDQQLQDLDKRTQTAVAEIEATADRLESAVKAWRRRLKELAMSTCSDAKTSVLDRKSLLSQRRGSLTSHKHVTQRVQGFSAHVSFGDMAAMMKTRVHDLDCSAKLPKGAKVISTLTLTIHPQAVSRIEQELFQLGQLHLTPVLQEVPRCWPLSSVETPAVETVSVYLRFHDNCGKKIKLSNNHQTAQRTSPSAIFSSDGMVISRDPMLTDMLYQVHIDETDNRYDYTGLGVVTANPDTFTLPRRTLFPNRAVVSVWADGVCRFGQMVNNVHWPVLKKTNVRIGTCVGLAVLATDRSLHLYVDGTHRGVVAPHVPDPCYFMFDLYSHCTQILYWFCQFLSWFVLLFLYFLSPEGRIKIGF